MKKGFVALLAALISISVFSNIVLAQTPIVLDKNLFEFMSKVLNIPTEWLEGNTILFNVILPFLAIFMIVVGFMKTLRIFNSGAIQWVLSFVIAFMMFPTGGFLLLVTFLMQMSAVLAVFGFVILFIAGVFLYSGIGMNRMYWKFERTGHLKQAHKKAITSVNNDIDSIDRRIKATELDMRRAIRDGNTDLYKELTKEREDLTLRRKELIEQLDKIRKTKV